MQGDATLSWKPAHPRSRGENTARGRRLLSWGGSSPLTRGKRRSGRAGRGRGRLIPAHAGKTADSLSGRPPCAAHPRSRGENFACGAAITKNVGSSPLTRGKPSIPRTGRIAAGLIPAHAGKTSPHPPGRWARPAHPRSRGENASVFLGIAWSVGSSPLTRGKPSLTRRP